MARLEKEYNDKLKTKIQKELNLSNVMEVPKVTKITLNMGVGEAVADKKVLDNALKDMEQIAGQKPVKTLARKSVAGFKIRDGYPIGCKVTLRRSRMYEFLDRLVNIAIPRIRDFRGLNPKSFDKQGNYSMGVSEQIIFPEINFDQIDVIRGMDITISTSAKNADEGRALLSAFNFPFKNQSQQKIKNESLEIKKESEDNPDQQGAEAE
ncbi:MAG: 50S ribosomal protein L5 [Gammaproteobacteria bacterium]|nr:MAG: 50S ribosomal protein L5 [Gammaproteobacteria bacterium]